MYLILLPRTLGTREISPGLQSLLKDILVAPAFQPSLFERDKYSPWRWGKGLMVSASGILRVTHAARRMPCGRERQLAPCG